MLRFLKVCSLSILTWLKLFQCRLRIEILRTSCRIHGLQGDLNPTWGPGVIWVWGRHIPFGSFQLRDAWTVCRIPYQLWTNIMMFCMRGMPTVTYSDTMEIQGCESLSLFASHQLELLLLVSHVLTSRWCLRTFALGFATRLMICMCMND